MQEFVKEIKEHLEKELIPFWENLKDDTYGGYFGYMGYDLTVDPQYEKGCILNSRILWFFSNAYLTLKEESCKDHADHAFAFLKDHCLDEEEGGVFWSVTYDGKVKDDTKHTYNQAFAVYALASYYDATKEEEAIKLAMNLFSLIEDKCTDEYGYMEAFNRKFEKMENDKLSENGVLAEKTMNTLLHVMEAYTELYRVTKEERVAECLRNMFSLFAEKVYHKEKGRLEVFFDKTWNPLLDLDSYGHDIEAAWLIDRGVEVLGEETYKNRMAPITLEITQNIYKRAYKEGFLVNEAEDGIVDMTRVWWVQAEGVVGFLNGYEKQPCVTVYLEIAREIWKFIQEHFVDKRAGSEWYWALNEKNEPVEKPIVEPWKCPYHNGRMCLEVIRRMDHVT